MPTEELPLYVFLDTQAFYAIGFDLQSSSFKSLKDRVNRDSIRLISTDIVEREVQHGIAVKLTEFNQSLRKAVKLAGVVRAIGDPRVVALQELVRNKIPASEAERAVTKFFRDFTESIPPPPNALGELFNKYFACAPPFGAGGKKNEFPDAANLIALLEFSQSMNTTVYIVSGDDDWRRTCASHPRLVHVPRLSELLDKVIRAEWLHKDFTPAEELLTLIKSQHDQLKPWITSALSSASMVEFGDGVIDHLEVHHLWFDEVAVTDAYEDGDRIRMYGELFLSVDYSALTSIEDDEMVNTIEGEQSGHAELACNIGLELSPAKPTLLKVFSVEFEDGLALRIPLKY